MCPRTAGELLPGLCRRADVRSVRLQGERRRVLPQEHRQLRSGAQAWGRVWPSWLNRVRPGWVGEALRRRRRCYRPRLGLGCSRCCLRLQHAEGRRKRGARGWGCREPPGPGGRSQAKPKAMGISDLRVPRARSPQAACRLQLGSASARGVRAHTHTAAAAARAPLWCMVYGVGIWRVGGPRRWCRWWWWSQPADGAARQRGARVAAAIRKLSAAQSQSQRRTENRSCRSNIFNYSFAGDNFW